MVLIANASNNVSAAPTAKQSAAGVVNDLAAACPSKCSGKRCASLTPQRVLLRPRDPGAGTTRHVHSHLKPRHCWQTIPNPFNPETWIPYQLWQKRSEVTVTIYASDGSVVRTLALGYQAAGMYKNRTQAAYWDGRNELGETVASGIYFYTLIAGEFIATRKMLILK